MILGSLLLLLPAVVTAQIQHIQGPPVQNNSQKSPKQKPPKQKPPKQQEPPKPVDEFEGKTAQEIADIADDYYFGSNGKPQDDSQTVKWVGLYR